MSILADIATGHSAGADVLFLIAAVVFGIAALVPALDRPVADAPGRPVYARISLVAVGLCLLAIAWLIL